MFSSRYCFWGRSNTEYEVYCVIICYDLIPAHRKQQRIMFNNCYNHEYITTFLLGAYWPKIKCEDFVYFFFFYRFNLSEIYR